MSPTSSSTSNNFLKTSIFNLEQEIKQYCEKGTKEIDELQYKAVGLKNRLLEKTDFPDKNKVIQNLDKYSSKLSVIRISKAELYNWIDYLYKTGNIDVPQEEQQPKSTKTTKKPKTVKTKKKTQK